MRSAGKDAPLVGIQLSKEFIKEAKSAVAGIYMMPPFQKYYVIDELLSVL